MLEKDYNKDLNLPEESEKQPDPIDSVVHVMTGPEYMYIMVKITPPMYGGKEADEEMIRKALADNSINYGINDELVRQLGQNPVYSKDFKLAEGTPPKNGVDGSIEYMVDISKTYKPQTREDGSVDFMELGYVTNISKGTLLAKVTPGTPGVNGRDVRGVLVSCRDGRTPLLTTGKNTSLSENGLELYAAADGRLDIKNDVINVDEVLVINGDVDSETGNISFLGDVTVKGDVREGFKVSCVGNLLIHGMVEGAYLKSDKEIQIKGGVSGMRKGTITAGGDVKTKYLESVNVTAAGTVYADSVLHSLVKADSIVLTGKRASFIGGTYIARKEISASVFGNDANFETNIIIESGTNFDKQKRTILKDMNDCKLNLTKEIEILQRFKKIIDSGSRNSKYIDMYKEALLKCNQLNQQIKDCEKRLEEVAVLELQFNSEGVVSHITVKSRMYPGVKIDIDGVQESVRVVYDRCMIVKQNGQLVFGEMPKG